MFELGMIVSSISGRDKHRYYVVVGLETHRVRIADGKIRKLENPKAKNPGHLSKTHKKIDLSEVNSNKALRKLLEPMTHSLKKRVDQ